MLKRYTFWLWLAVVILFLTGLIHSISLFISPVPANEVERQMIELMTHNKMDMGAGFHRTMWDLLTALSASFTFFCLLGGLTIGYLLKMKAPLAILKGIVRIHLLIFAGLFCRRSGLCFSSAGHLDRSLSAVSDDWGAYDSKRGRASE